MPIFGVKRGGVGFFCHLARTWEHTSEENCGTTGFTTKKREGIWNNYQAPKNI